MRVTAASRADFDWLKTRTGCSAVSNAIKAVDERGLIRGMVGFESWTKNSVQAHMAVDTPIVWRSLIPAVFEYPFLEVGVGVLLGIIPASNAKSCRMVERLGFTKTHAVRNGWEVGVDLVVYEMRREDCPYLGHALAQVA